MTVKPLLSCAGLMAVTTLLASAPARAQQPAAGEHAAPSLTITGFEGVPFGVDRATAVQARGEPEDERALDSGLRLLLWRDELEGQPSILLFGFLPDEGFVKAQELVDLEATGLAGEACVEFVRQIHHDVDLRYPLIRPAERAKNNSRDAICEAAAEGLAFWYRQWRDDETGTVVTVGLGSGATQVELTYESLAFRDWVTASGGETVPLVEERDGDDGALRAID